MHVMPLARSICLRNMGTKNPGSMKFISLEKGSGYSKYNFSGSKIRVASYNILAQVYVKSCYFPHSPSSCLKWKARSQEILSDIRSLDADFLCLQEVDEYDNFYKHNIERYGYSGIYVKRSGQKKDGCAIFYKHDRAEMLLDEKIDYNTLVDSVQDIPVFSKPNDSIVHEADNGLLMHSSSDERDPNDTRLRLKRDCVGIVAAFMLKNSCEHVVIVANSHLYWDPEWADVKLAQAKHLLLRLSQFKARTSEMFCCAPSVIVAGDFNSTPNDEVYEYILSGSPSLATGASPLLPICLQSVYGSTRGEPQFTNCTPEFTNTLDYIFYSPGDDLEPVSLLELPTSDSPEVAGGLPNFSHPSDHLPIAAEFLFRKSAGRS